MLVSIAFAGGCHVISTYYLVGFGAPAPILRLIDSDWRASFCFVFAPCTYIDGMLAERSVEWPGHFQPARGGDTLFAGRVYTPSLPSNCHLVRHDQPNDRQNNFEIQSSACLL